MRALLQVSLYVVILFAGQASYSQCECINPNMSALEEYERATVVFTGEIVDIRVSPRDKDDRYYETVKISVDHAWKANLNPIVTIKNYVYGCSQGWEKGDKYLVYGYLNKDNETYWTGCCCSRTGPLSKTQPDIDAFFDAGYARSHVKTPHNEKIISAGWMNSRALNFKQPKYPSGIKKPKPSARIDVRIITDTDGNVISADIMRGPVKFHAAALDAARGLKFPPTKVVGWVSYNFKP